MVFLDFVQMKKYIINIKDESIEKIIEMNNYTLYIINMLINFYMHISTYE